MFLQPVYKGIKTKLSILNIPIFFYIGQYKRGKENTSYVVPAIYIEMPKENSLDFYGRKIMVAKNAPMKVHYISHAPFKNHDNEVQDEVVALHEAKLREIDLLITGWHVKDVDENKLTEQFLPRAGSFLNFEDKCVSSVLSYTADIYSRHQMAG